MIYLVWYLVVGSVILISVSAFHMLKSEHNIEESSITNPHHNKWWYRIRTNVLLILAFVFLFIPFWPILLYIKIKNAYFAQQPALQAPPTQPFDPFDPFEPFTVAQTDLLEQLTVQSIEQREMVYDPLGAAPSKAFGHLNSAWINFTHDLRDDDQIWSFAATWPIWFGGRKELKTGYVIVSGNAIGRYFLAMNKRITKSAEN